MLVFGVMYFVSFGLVVAMSENVRDLAVDALCFRMVSALGKELANDCKKEIFRQIKNSSSDSVGIDSVVDKVDYSRRHINRTVNDCEFLERKQISTGTYEIVLSFEDELAVSLFENAVIADEYNEEKGVPFTVEEMQ